MKQAPIYWRDITGERRTFDEMETNHLLNAADHLEERVARLRGVQKTMRSTARARVTHEGYGESVGRELQRSAAKRSWCLYVRRPRPTLW